MWQVDLACVFESVEWVSKPPSFVPLRCVHIKNVLQTFQFTKLVWPKNFLAKFIKHGNFQMYNVYKYNCLKWSDISLICRPFSKHCWKQTNGSTNWYFISELNSLAWSTFEINLFRVDLNWYQIPVSLLQTSPLLYLLSLILSLSLSLCLSYLPSLPSPVLLPPSLPFLPLPSPPQSL